MKKEIFEIKSNTALNEKIYKLVLFGNTSEIKRSGQFVNILIEGQYLRRPISVCDYSNDSLTLIYKVVGKGTEKLSKMTNGSKLDLLVGLGNGYDTSLSGNTPLLIGGGVGVPPLYNLCKKLVEEGKNVKVILGFNNKEEKFYEDEFKKLTNDVTIVTVDGSYGEKGFVTDSIKEGYSYFYTCGPEAMLKSVYNKTTTEGQFSFEERMGCGFGACMGCTCKTIYGNKRICKDGPVLQKGEILWG